MIPFKNSILILLLLLSALPLFAQSEPVEMADVLRRDGKIYTVVAGVVVILTAMIVLLIRVDRKLSRLERESEK